MHGLAGALHKIHSCTVPGEKRDFNLYGYHFDIKPANILVENSGKFVITDFGQANFKQRAGTSRVTGMGGTEAYAPPEIEQRDAKPNRKYDVWSLGCVFLELCTFVALRYKGVSDLDDIKISRSADGRRVYESFFQAAMIPGTYQLKPSISKWVRDMPGSTNASEDSRKFLAAMLDLTERMLHVNVEDRLTSHEVLITMESILKLHLPEQNQTTEKIIRQVPLEIDETDLCAGRLNNLPLLSQLSGGQWKKSPIRITERTDGTINLIIVDHNEVEHFEIGLRSVIELIPQYAFHDESHNPLSGSHIVMMPRRFSNRAHIRHIPLVFNEIRDSYILQSNLMQQDIQRSLSLDKFELELGFWQRTMRKLQGKGALNRETLGKVSTIQLWSERALHNPMSQSPTDSRSLSLTASHFAVLRPPNYRIVIYSASVVIAVTLSKASRLRREVPMVLRLEPMDISTKSKFRAHVIATRKTGVPPSLPLDREKLDQREENGEFSCQGMTLTFQTNEDADVFFNTYMDLKKKWTDEYERIRQNGLDMRDLIGRGHD